MEYHVKNTRLANEGKRRIEWSEMNMPVLTGIKKTFVKKKPFKGIKISACLHVTTETANLVISLDRGGADIVLCASNPLSTQDDVAASLVKDFGISVFAVKGEDTKSYYSHINKALDNKPNITMDDGADLITMIHLKRNSLFKNIIGGTEETTTGVIRLRSLERSGRLLYPVISVNDANTKHLFDNRYGTGQSTIDGILRATNRLLSGSQFVVCGYGWCGRGVAMRAKGMGAIVTVCETEPLKALEAAMDGFNVMKLREASKIGDIFVTLTGDRDVITGEHFKLMKEGALMANAGHFNVEIDISSLTRMSKRKRKIRPNVDEYTLKNGKRLNLLGEGRLINLSSAEGHPANVMDMSFSNQALSCEYLVRYGKTMGRKVYPVPAEIDKRVARLKLKSMGIKIDTLSTKQQKYLESWKIGT